MPQAGLGAYPLPLSTTPLGTILLGAACDCLIAGFFVYTGLMRIHLVALIISLGVLAPARAGLLALEVDPQTLGLRTEAATLADSLGYTAYWEDGSPAFEFNKPASVEPLGEGHFRLSYEATLESGESLRATCELTQQSHRLSLDWTFDLPELTQPLSPWSCGFRFAFPNAPTSAEQRPWVKWVKPTGEADLAGDTPYPDLATYLRKVRFGQVDLVFATPWYDPDWFYKRDLGRTHFIRWRPPEPGKPATVSFSLIAADEATPDALLAAVATEQVLWWRLDSPEGAKVFLPGQDVTLELALGDTSGAPQEARLSLEARDYYGKQLASVDKVLPLTRRAVCRSAPAARPGGAGDGLRGRHARGRRPDPAGARQLRSVAGA